MLTRLQKIQIAKDAGFAFEKYHDREEIAAFHYGTKVNIHDETMAALDAAYALGIAAGKAEGAAEMRERAAKCAEAIKVGQPHLLTVTETHVMDMTATEAAKAIRALKETP